MSLWDWIIEAIVGPSPTASARHSTRKAERPRGSTHSVAVLDEPGETEPSPDESFSPPWYAPEGVTVTEPVPVPKPELSEEGQALERALVSELDVHTLVLPSLPHAPEAVLRCLADPECSFREVADIIAQDQVTATVALRAANAAFWGARKVTSLIEAVTRLGAVALRTLMLSESLRAAAFCKERHNRDLAELLWRRSVAGGCVMRALAEFTGKLDPEDAFVVGLLHDVGNVIVLQTADSMQQITHNSVDLETFEYVCYECHEMFGELIAQKWNLPPRLKELIQNHHNHPPQDDPLRDDRLLLMLTDMINAMLGYGPSADYDLLRCRPAQDLAIADQEAFRRFLADLPAQLERNMAEL